MADIHFLPARTGNDVDRLTTLLTNAFAEGVDLGPRGDHIVAIANTLEQQVESLRQMADEFRDSPIRTMVDLDQLEAHLSRLSDSIAKLAAIAQGAAGWPTLCPATCKH